MNVLISMFKADSLMGRSAMYNKIFQGKKTTGHNQIVCINTNVQPSYHNIYELKKKSKNSNTSGS